MFNATLNPIERESWMCLYIGRPCSNPRVFNGNSRSGGFLQLCEHHRALANRNQRRYVARRRMPRIHQPTTLTNPTNPVLNEATSNVTLFATGSDQLSDASHVTAGLADWQPIPFDLESNASDFPMVVADDIEIDSMILSLALEMLAEMDQ